MCVFICRIPPPKAHFERHKKPCSPVIILGFVFFQEIIMSDSASDIFCGVMFMLVWCPLLVYHIIPHLAYYWVYIQVSDAQKKKKSLHTKYYFSMKFWTAQDML